MMPKGRNELEALARWICRRLKGLEYYDAILTTKLVAAQIKVTKKKPTCRWNTAQKIQFAMDVDAVMVGSPLQHAFEAISTFRERHPERICKPGGGVYDSRSLRA